MAGERDDQGGRCAGTGTGTGTGMPVTGVRDVGWRARALALARDDDGMSTAEYAIGTIAAAAFAALLYTVVTGDGILGALTGIVQRALTAAF